MRKLTLVGLSGDGQQAIFVDDAGIEFVTPADDKLRAALRGDRARLGQLEIEMQSALRPRDIQARIRAGESPETVAALAQVPVDKIMAYCVPVLAERRHIAELAQRSHVRRKNADGPAQRLADMAAGRLRSRGVDPQTAEWESWRREDGRWVVEVTYRSGEHERQAHFVFDAAGRYSVADDDEAKWLTGERQSTSKGPQPRDGANPGERRLAAVPDGDDLLNLPEVQPEDRADFNDEGTDDLTAVARAVREPDPSSPAASSPHTAGDTDVDALPTQHSLRPSSDELAAERDPEAAEHHRLDGSVATDRDSSIHEVDAERGEPSAAERSEPGESATQAAPTQTVAEDAAPPPRETEPTPTARRRRTGKRASVPSWDEIMFGKGKQD